MESNSLSLAEARIVDLEKKVDELTNENKFLFSAYKSCQERNAALVAAIKLSIIGYGKVKELLEFEVKRSGT